MDFLNNYYFNVIFKVILVCLCSFPLGFNRSKKGMPVGIRTHTIVALLGLLTQLAGVEGSDPTRLAGQFISGIGFLCAGNILKNEDARKVRGLTTSAVIFGSGIIGIAIGLNKFFEAILISGVITFFLARHFNNPKRKENFKNQ